MVTVTVKHCGADTEVTVSNPGRLPAVCVLLRNDQTSKPVGVLVRADQGLKSTFRECTAWMQRNVTPRCQEFLCLPNKNTWMRCSGQQRQPRFTHLIHSHVPLRSTTGCTGGPAARTGKSLEPFSSTQHVCMMGH